MMVPAAGPADPPGRAGAWLALTASERGASHVAVSAPNQDAVGTGRAGADGIVAAVADGHGHQRHMRSSRGSRFAVSIGCQVGQELADRLATDKTFLSQPESGAGVPGTAEAAAVAAEAAAAAAEGFVVPTVIRRWREAVLADVAADPFTQAEQDLRHRGDDATIAYGSTLLLGVALGGWLILAQIGDGDVVAVRADGSAEQPVPVDPQLDGRVTTSLCGADPAADFRVTAVDLTASPLLAVLLATDGYGNAQVVNDWPIAFGRDISWLLRERDVRWLAGQVPAWAARCASADGSADDTTIALLLSPAALAAMATAAEGQAAAGADDADPGSEDTTIPAVNKGDTMPGAQVRSAGRGPIEPITVRQPVPAPVPDPLPAPAPADQDTTEWEPPAASAGAGAR